MSDGLVESANGTCQIALVERHRATGGVVNAFVLGFGYEGKMAMASTVAHDSHHMIVVGTDRAHMAMAANRLAEIGGESQSIKTVTKRHWLNCLLQVLCLTNPQLKWPRVPKNDASNARLRLHLEQCLHATFVAGPSRNT